MKLFTTQPSSRHSSLGLRQQLPAGLFTASTRTPTPTWYSMCYHSYLINDMYYFIRARVGLSAANPTNDIDQFNKQTLPPLLNSMNVYKVGLFASVYHVCMYVEYTSIGHESIC